MNEDNTTNWRDIRSEFCRGGQGGAFIFAISNTFATAVAVVVGDGVISNDIASFAGAGTVAAMACLMVANLGVADETGQASQSHPIAKNYGKGVGVALPFAVACMVGTSIDDIRNHPPTNDSTHQSAAPSPTCRRDAIAKQIEDIKREGFDISLSCP